MDNFEKELLLIKQEFKNHKEVSTKEISDLVKKTEEQEKRIVQLEMNNTKTDLQYAQIMEILNKLNEKTIPDLILQIEELKNKPVKRYDQVITAIISAVVGGIVGFGVNKLLGK